jgi:glyoxylase-like metal-dependent hydrolase (beta-lactamase superfamily II)
MKLQVFNVEHGACALLTDDNNKRIMIDCGHNASARWYPGSALIGAGIDRIEALFVTNYDEDHVSGIRDLFGKVTVGSIWRNATVSPSMIRHLKSTDGIGPGIDFLVATLEAWTKTGGSTSVASSGLTNVEVSIFCNTP